MPHKYQATIDLMKSVIHKLPAVFPQDRHQQMEGAIAALERDPNASLDAIEAKLIIFGLELWPYCEAYDKFYKIYGEAKERKLMREKLSPAAREALDKFVADGGDIESVRDGAKFEHFFNEDIREEIISAELEAHDGVHEEMEKLLSGEKNADFAALLADFQNQLAAISKKIAELKNLAARSPERSAEILDKAKTFEEGFAYVERPPTLDDVTREIQYYVDIMEV